MTESHGSKQSRDRRGSECKTAVILAGGKGTRLRPYTTSFPKPLMPVGDRPVLEILIEQLIRDGFTDLRFAVGHLAELIEAYFGDGTRWGDDVTIAYSHETSPLGTAGPLAMLVDGLPENFIVVNGDVLSDLDYRAFLESHHSNDPARVLTISTHKRICVRNTASSMPRPRVWCAITAKSPRITYLSPKACMRSRARRLRSFPRINGLIFPISFSGCCATTFRLSHASTPACGSTSAVPMTTRRLNGFSPITRSGF